MTGSDDDSSASATPVLQEELATPETLISGTIAALRDTEGADVALLDILTEHILTMTPADKAVANAATAIEALAVRRAEEPDHGTAGHD